MVKKKESLLEKGKEIVDEVVDEVESVVEHVVDAVEETISGEENAKTEKKAEKKTTKSVSKKKVEKVEDKTDKLAALKEKAKALEGKVKESGKLDIKSEVSGEKEDKKDLLVPIEDYLKSSIHLGTRVITPDMRKYVYKRRADGLAVFNTNLVDDKLREGAEYLAKFAPENIVVVCKREAGWDAVSLFGESLGIRTFTKKYPAGSLTNPNLDKFIEADLVLICDPWLDKNALKDSNDIRVKVMGVCDTNNFIKGIDQIVIGNNKSAKSLGMILHVLAKLYSEKRKMNVKVPEIDEFVSGWADAQIPA